MSGKRVRDVLRTFHVVAGLVIGLLLYQEPGEMEALRKVAQFVLAPVTVITGLWMWKQAKVRRWLSRGDKGGRPRRTLTTARGK